MKQLSIFSALLFSISLLQAQEISGLWTGYLSTTEKTLPYELVISKKNNEFIAYSHTTFNVNGKDIISVKKQKVSYEMRHLILEDEDLLKNNFEKSAPKKISQTAELDFRMNGKQMMLEGSFKTKGTRSLRPAQGVIILYKNPDPENAGARIQSDLKELKLDDALVVFKPLPPVDVAITPPVTQPAVATRPAEITPTPTPKNATVTAVTKPAASNRPVSTNKPVASPVVSAKPVTIKPSPAETKPATQVPVVAAVPASPLPVLPTVNLNNRKIEIIENITVFNDSLVFSIYDNGEVDGDTVSVIMNGITIMSKQKLTTRATSQTVYLTPELGDSLQIVMFAENMGIYPPNTGLLIIQDGNRRREVRFSGDLNKNAAILLRRNKL